MTTTFAYHNITISGLPGCGSTTMLKGLRSNLQDLGWQGFSGGEFMRHYATEKGYWDPNNPAHHYANIYTDEFENEVDFGIRDKLANDQHWIIESWLAGFLGQNLPHVLKILMICSSEAVRIDRVVNRDGISVEQAKHNTKDRYRSNLHKWRRLYAQQWQDWVVATGKASPDEPIDFWREDLYDLVLDTYSLSPEQTLNLVMDKLQEG